MNIHIWIKKEDVLTGSITTYLTSITNKQGTSDYVQVSITPDEFAILEDTAKGDPMGPAISSMVP